MQNGKTLYVLDGYAALFRAFYAIRNPLYSPVTGEPTQAILVFAQMLLKLYNTLTPDYVVVAWDAPGKTFRDALFSQYAELAAISAAAEPAALPPVPPTPAISAPEPTEPAPDASPHAGLVEPAPAVPLVAPPPDPAPLIAPAAYKGTRRQTPPSLHEQTPRILELLEIFNIPVIGKPGLEADDVIAALTARVMDDPAHPDVRVRIVSRDKDLEQLIGDRVTLFDVHTGTELGAADLWNKRGIAPHQVVDFLSLTGDVVDNIPGVPGIGPKTAAKLLQQFGTLDDILSHVANGSSETPALSAALRENLERARPVLPLSRQLVTLRPDADIPFALETARARPVPTGELEAFCDALGFTSLKKQLLKSPPASQ